MKNVIAVFLMITVFCLSAYAQTAAKPELNESTIVRDSSGMQYQYIIWKKLLSTGNYMIKSIRDRDNNTTFLLCKLTQEQKDQTASRLQKPPDSKFFTTGEKIRLFDCRDINGNKIKLKDLQGKVVVLNFWFIGCPPCRMEIPEINKISEKYANDPNVVFIAIALDEKSDITDFIKTNPFGYHIIEDGRYYANLYKINLYPTNVVLNKEGKVQFHASGYALNTPYWIKKTIEEAVR